MDNFMEIFLKSFETCVKMDIPDKIVIGMLSEDFSNCITELVKIKNKYPIFVEFLIGNILILHLYMKIPIYGVKQL